MHHINVSVPKITQAKIKIFIEFVRFDTVIKEFYTYTCVEAIHFVIFNTPCMERVSAHIISSAHSSIVNTNWSKLYIDSVNAVSNLTNSIKIFIFACVIFGTDTFI